MKQASRTVSAALAFLASVGLPVGCAAPGHEAFSAPPALQASDLAWGNTQHSAGNDIPPRLQWEANHGYCGEVSMISAGLYYGQYASQYEARDLASDGIPQYLGRSQLLLGGDDRRAARLMHLNAVEWDTATERSTDDFLTWVKANVVAGYPVIIGIYMNYYRFYGDHNPHAGAVYDHIVPVTGISSVHPLQDRSYYASDTLTFSDNGVWSGNHRPYIFTFAFGALQRDRVQANEPSAPVYSLPDRANNYGVTITGIMDQDRETLPVRVATDANYEHPSMQQGSTQRPAWMPLTLTVTVSNLQPGQTYNLYRYDSFAAVPDAAFNANAKHAFEHWSIRIASGSTYTLTEHIRSDEVAAYRAVNASSP